MLLVGTGLCSGSDFQGPCISGGWRHVAGFQAGSVETEGRAYTRFAPVALRASVAACTQLSTLLPCGTRSRRLRTGHTVVADLRGTGTAPSRRAARDHMVLQACYGLDQMQTHAGVEVRLLRRQSGFDQEARSRTEWLAISGGCRSWPRWTSTPTRRVFRTADKETATYYHMDTFIPSTCQTPHLGGRPGTTFLAEARRMGGSAIFDHEPNRRYALPRPEDHPRAARNTGAAATIDLTHEVSRPEPQGGVPAPCGRKRRCGRALHSVLEVWLGCASTCGAGVPCGPLPWPEAPWGGGGGGQVGAQSGKK